MPEEGCDLQKNLGELFVLFRKSRGMTQREAAVLCDTSQAQITYLEKGQGNLKLDTLVKYAKAYGYDIEVVFSVPSSDSEPVEPIRSFSQDGEKHGRTSSDVLLRRREW